MDATMQQLPALGVAAPVCTSLKVWRVLTFAEQLPTTRNNMQQGVQTDVTCRSDSMESIFGW